MMKSTTDIMIEDTEVQIIVKGSKVRVVDVEKRKWKRGMQKKFTAVVLGAALLLSSGMYVVNLQYTEVALGRQNYELKNEIDCLEKENYVLEKNGRTMIDYEDVWKRAKKLGMHFPDKNQVVEYQKKKSTVIRIHGF